MKLQNYRRLLKTDFSQDDQKLIEQIGESVNPGIEILYQALNKRLTIGDNLQATERDVEVRVNASGNPINSTFANSDFNSPVRNVFVGKVENLTNSSVYPTASPFISWSNTTSGIQINNITGLPTGNTFRLRIILFG